MYFGSLKPGREAKMERYQVTFKALSKPTGSPSPETIHRALWELSFQVSLHFNEVMMCLSLIQLFCTQSLSAGVLLRAQTGPFSINALVCRAGNIFLLHGCFFSSALLQSSGIWLTVNNCLANCKVMNIVR